MTGSGLIAVVLGLFDTWGYLITFISTVLENIAVVGMFIPGDLVVILASFSTHNGPLFIWGMAVASILGTVVGNNITYWFFTHAGRDVLLRLGRFIESRRFLSRILKINEETILGAERYFQVHGAQTVFLARFVTGFKGFIIAIAGVGRMSLLWFEVYTLLSAICYSILMCAIGWFIGDNIDFALQVVSGVGYAGLGIFAFLVLSVWFTASRAANKRKVKQLENLGEELEVSSADGFDDGER